MMNPISIHVSLLNKTTIGGIYPRDYHQFKSRCFKNENACSEDIIDIRNTYISALMLLRANNEISVRTLHMAMPESRPISSDP